MNKSTRPSVDQMFQNMIGRQTAAAEQPAAAELTEQKRKNTVQVTVRMRPEQHRRLKEEAFHRDCDMSELVREALDQYFSE